MQNLPVEVLERIALYLNKKDAKALSGTCKLGYEATLNRIWNDVIFTFVHIIPSNPIFASHLPIRILYSADFWILDSILLDRQNIKELRINEPIFLSSDIYKFAGCDFKVILYTDMLRWPPSLLDDIRFMDNIEIISSNWGELSYADLLEYHGLTFRTLDFGSLCVHERCKEQFIDLLLEMDIREILISTPGCGVGFDFMKKDIMRLANLNVKEISTIYLADGEDKYFPWLELKAIKELKRITFERKCFISIEKLKCFKVKYITVSDHKYIVKDIVSALARVDGIYVQGLFIPDIYFVIHI